MWFSKQVKRLFLTCLIVLIITTLIDYYSVSRQYKSEVSFDGIETSTIETNDLLLDIYSEGIFSRNSKVLVSTSESITGKSYIFAASRNNNVLKSFEFQKKKNYLKEVSELELKHSESTFRESNGLRKSKYFIFDLLTLENKIFASVVRTYDGDKKCDDVMILAINFDKETGRLLGEEKSWQYNGCLKWRDDAEPSGNLSLRLAANSVSIFMAVGLEPVLPYTNVFPNNALIGLPATLEATLNNNPIFGSIVKIPISSEDIHDYNVVARGLRSPQGLLYVSRKDYPSELWISDHGPRGGDELNILRLENKKVDFGWPKVSLGTYYMNSDGQTPGSLPVKCGYHGGYKAPIFYWTPSIAPSQISEIPGSFSSISTQWGKNNLILATLKDSSLHKLNIGYDYHVASDERIFIGERLRDITYNSEGIVLGTDSGKMLLVTPRQMKIHTGSFPPTLIYSEPQKPSFSRYLKSRFQELLGRTNSVLGR